MPKGSASREAQTSPEGAQKSPPVWPPVTMKRPAVHVEEYAPQVQCTQKGVSGWRGRRAEVRHVAPVHIGTMPRGIVRRAIARHSMGNDATVKTVTVAIEVRHAMATGRGPRALAQQAQLSKRLSQPRRGSETAARVATGHDEEARPPCCHLTVEYSRPCRVSLAVVAGSQWPDGLPSSHLFDSQL